MKEVLKNKTLLWQCSFFIILFMIPLIVYYTLYANNMAYFDADGIQFFSAKMYIIDSLKNGEFPYWNKYLSNGIPFAMDLYGVFYPLNYLGLFLSPKNFIYVYYAIHLAIGAFFTYKYCNLLCKNKSIPIAMAFIYLFSIHVGGYRKGHIVLICSIVYLPVIVYYMEKYVITRKTKNIVLAALFMSIQFMTCMMQYILYTDITIGIYLIWRLLQEKAEFKKSIKDMLLCGISYIGLVAVQLFPVLFLMKEYSKLGSSEVSFDYFKTYSIHFIKLIQMIIPNFFNGEIFQAYGFMYSSEMDIELFLGVCLFSIIFYSFLKYFKKPIIKISFVIMAGVFLYSANAHVPYLSNILYKLPIIGNFRCSARALFIFIFFGYIIAAVTMDTILAENKIKDLLKFEIKFELLLIGFLGVVTLTLIILNLIDVVPFDSITKYQNYIKLAFVKTVIVLAVVILFLLFSKYFVKKQIAIIVPVFIMLLTIFETYGFYVQTIPVNMDKMFHQDNETIAQIKKDIGNEKLWVAFPGIDGSFHSLFSQNANVIDKIPTLNAYIAFNNPAIYRIFSGDTIAPVNSSGLLTGSINAAKNVYEQNEMLSMLGIKYIVDPFYLLTDEGSISQLQESALVYEKDSIIIPPVVSENVEYFLEAIPLKSNTSYKIEFNAKCQNNGVLVVDFYGDTYDFAEQEDSFNLSAENNSFSTVINSATIPEGIETFIRTISSNTSQVEISNFKVTELNTVYVDNRMYEPYIINEESRIFENKNVKDILFVPQTIVSVESFEQLYTNPENYNLADTSYVRELENKNLTDLKYQIKNTEFKNNSIRADVVFSKDGFINFSQNYYPDWRAYIDGKKTPIYMVNGVIQGIEVPAGEHTIEFKITSPILNASAVLSVGTLLFILYFLIRKEKENVQKK